MDDLDLDDHAWPIWHPITGGLADVDTYYQQYLQDPDESHGLPCIVTNGHGRFLRSDTKGWWFCCTADGEFDDEECPPGLLKIRAHLGKGCMYTSVAAPMAIGIIPGVGTPYRGIVRIFEHADGSTKIGEVWHFKDGSRALADSQGKIQAVTR